MSPFSFRSKSSSNAVPETISEDGAAPVTFKSSFADSSFVVPSSPPAARVDRRTSVSAEALNPLAYQNAEDSIPQRDLTEEQLSRLHKSVSNNFLFSNLDPDSLNTVLRALNEKPVSKGTEIIKQGEEGDYFYIVESGNVEYYKDGAKVHESGPGSSFGELALMYNAPRAATVTAVSDCNLWALDRVSFRKILLEKTYKKRNLYGQFLKTVPFLQSLSDYELKKLSDALSSKTFEANTVVVKEGEVGEEFYLVESGKAEITKKGEHVAEVTKGGYFGELALLYDAPRQATVTAVDTLRVATLGKSGFERLLGPAVEELKKNDPTHGAVKH